MKDENKTKKQLVGELQDLRHYIKTLENKQAELRQNLNTSIEDKNLYLDIYRCLNNAVLLVAPNEDRILDANEKASELLGYTRDEFLSLPISTIHPNEMFSMKKFADKVFENGNGWTDELTCIARSGDIVHTSISASKLTIGDKDCMLAIITDISERKRSERVVQENIDSMLKINRKDRIIRLVTQGVHKSLNLDRIFDNIVKTIHENMHNAENAAIFLVEGDFMVLKAHRGFDPGFISTLSRIPRGAGYLWYSVVNGVNVHSNNVQEDKLIGDKGKKAGIKSYMASPIFYQGKSIGAVSLCSMHTTGAYSNEDIELLSIIARQAELAITHARQTSELSDSEKRFRVVADSAPIMIWISGIDKLLTFVNQGWLDFTGRTFDQEIGNGWSELIHPDDLERTFKLYNKSFDAREQYSIETRFKRQDGEYRWLLITGVPRYEGGNFMGFIGSCVDVTDRMDIEIKLRNNETLLRLIDRLSESSHQGLGDGETVKSVLDIIVEHFQNMRVSYSHLDPVGNFNTLVALLPEPEFELKAIEADVSIAPKYIEMLSRGETVVVSDVTKDQNIGLLSGVFKSTGSMAFLEVPVDLGSDLIGVITIESYQPREWSGEEINLIEDVAKQLSHTLGETRYNEDMQNIKNLSVLDNHALNMTTDGVCIVDVDGLIIKTNPSFDNMFGYKHDNLVNRNLVVLDCRTLEENSHISELIANKIEKYSMWKGNFKNLDINDREFMTQVQISFLDIAGTGYWITVHKPINLDS